MAYRFSTGLSNAILNSGLAAAFDGGTARINIYTGSQPAVDAASTGTLLATLTPGSDVFGTAAAKSLAANSITGDTSADNTGAPGHFVLYRTGDTAPTSAAGTGDLRLTGTCTVNGGGGDLDLTIAGGGSNVVAGGAVSMSALTVTGP